MSELKPSKLVCKVCGYEPNIITDVCLKCGGEVVKICGKCGAENLVEAARCKNCGSLLALSPHKKIDLEDEKPKDSDKKQNEQKEDIQQHQKAVLGGLEFESVLDAVSKKDISWRKKESMKERQQMQHTSNDVGDIEKVKHEIKVIESLAKNTMKSEEVKQQKIEKKKDVGVYILVSSVFLLVFALVFVFFIRPSYSRYNLMFTAKKYLSSLKDEDWEGAYSLLTQNSKANISLSDYAKSLSDYYSKIGKWDFKDIEVYKLTKNEGIIKYKLIENGIERDDYLNFVKEYGRWRRPFVYSLFDEIEDALAKKDMSRALFLAQKLYLIDPMDPRSSGYLCWCEYFMYLFDKSVESCKRVVELSKTYPIKYYSDEEIFWYTFNYADSLKYIGKIEESIDIYSSLLTKPDISEKGKCSILITRSDAFVLLKRYEYAKNDISKALEVCDGIEKKEAVRRLDMLEGNMCPDAVLFAKKYRYKEDRSIEDIIDEEVKNVEGSLLYSCQYVKGPIYSVSAVIKKGKRIVKSFSFEVDLWEKTLKVMEGM